jgi:hypothetical protein
MAMRIPRTQYEWDRPAVGITEQEFDKGVDLWEGINGKGFMNTKFENTERLQVMNPRGDQAGNRPMPRDAGFFEADNHHEWGFDSFNEAEYNREFAHLRQDPYKGRGTPSNEMLSPNANPSETGGGCASIAEPESDPRDQGIGQKTP